MSVILKIDTNIKIGYSDKLEFLHDQAKFTEVFGGRTAIIAPNIETS